MGLTAERLRAGMDALARIEPGIAAGIARHGYPDTRIRARGHATMLRTIIGQQVSVQSAAAIWGRMEQALGAEMAPEVLAAAPDEMLRACGLSRQKSGYVKSLAELVASGEVDFANLPVDDEEAIATLTRIKGIGRWSAEIYLLFAEGRGDIWPAGDLAVQIEVGILLGHDARPSETLVREIAEAWRPHRGAAAIFAWHHYGARIAAGRAEGKGGKMPL
ncbi:DNA-3-methyladenine glycosylase family protein [Sphingomonas bacterium]|uniref:DNA-3-methyladenine glycosylase family protein n=1 Tax=Sphingomonas bacterium TaxID=1895847 RepID=UPI001575FFA4|nr:DNA-3-methyladenine glycosylase 2 family protein [Sphingomonas bacterium]